MASERGVFDRGEHAVQRMAELVEHGSNVIPSEQGRLARSGLREIRDVIYDGNGSCKLRGHDERTCPSAALLVIALEVVDIEECERLAIGLAHLEYADI